MGSKKVTQRQTCRVSGEKLIELFSLGDIYVSDFIPLDSDPRLQKVELCMCLSPTTGLVQLAHTAPSDDMYQEYWYRSGTNETMTRELKDIAESAQRLAKTTSGDVWVDIGCNDGTLLRFVDSTITRIGFDPAKNGFAEEAQKHAEIIINDYFSANAFKKHSSKSAKVVTSIAMFYDLGDPHAFVSDIKETLDDDGLWVIQMSYLPLMLEQLAFDNICHEHLEYYSLTSLKHLLDKHDLKIVDCQLNDVNGGSFRIYIQKEDANETSFGTSPYRDVAKMRVASILNYEKTLRLEDPKTYETFYKKMCLLKEQTVDFIKKEKAKGKKIWGYGASTKGNTLLQWFGIDHTLLDGIAERSPAKYGLKTPGTNIPITDEKNNARSRARLPSRASLALHQ